MDFFLVVHCSEDWYWQKSVTQQPQYASTPGKKGEYSTLCWNVLKGMIRCHPKHPETLSLVDFVDAFIFFFSTNCVWTTCYKGIADALICLITMCLKLPFRPDRLLGRWCKTTIRGGQLGSSYRIYRQRWGYPREPRQRRCHKMSKSPSHRGFLGISGRYCKLRRFF